MRILVLNGPKLDQLGTREPEIYGTSTMADLEQMCRARAAELGASIDLRQTDSEDEMVRWIAAASSEFDAIVINPAAFTHYSLGVSEALQGCSLPIVEVHISNIYAREPWRRRSLVSSAAVGVIAGLGLAGYLFAIEALWSRSQSRGPAAGLGKERGDGS